MTANDGETTQPASAAPGHIRLAALAPLAGLRLAAAIIVMCCHSGIPQLMAVLGAPPSVRAILLNAYTGLTFFFLLSGFMLQLIYGGRVTPTRQVRTFLVARLARIYPVYLLSIALMAVFVGRFAWPALPQFFMLQSWGPAAWRGFENWNMVAWTLSLELFFYLCFPFLAPLVHRLGARSIDGAIVLVCVFIVIAGTPSAGLAAPVHPWLNTVPMPLLRLPEFALGMLVAERYRRTDGRRLPIPAGAAMALFWIVLVSADPAIVSGGLAVASALVIYTLVTNPQAMSARLYSHRLVMFLATASYAIYLLHQPIHFALVALGGGSKAVIALQYPIVVLLSLATYFGVEEPCRRWLKRRFTPRGARPQPLLEGLQPI